MKQVSFLTSKLALGALVAPLALAGATTQAQADNFYAGVVASYNTLGGSMTSVESDTDPTIPDLVLSSRKQRSSVGGGLFGGYKFVMHGWSLSTELGADFLGRPSLEKRPYAAEDFSSVKVKPKQSYSLNMIASVPATTSLSVQGLVGLSMTRFQYDGFSNFLSSRHVSKTVNQFGPTLGIGFESKFHHFALGAMIKHTWYGKKSQKLCGPSSIPNETISLTSTHRLSAWQVGLRLTVPFSS